MTFRNSSSGSYSKHHIFPPKHVFRFWNNICIERLRAEFGESKEDKCRRLATELSAIKQEHGESVEQFAFKYKKLLHQLEKLGEKIAKDCPTFVISQFISKVNPLIAQHLVVKASEFETLDKIVEAARRVEVFKLRPPPQIQISRWMNGK